MLGIRKVVLTGVLAALAGGQAWAVTLIASCPFLISVPGNYVVTTDLTCGGFGIIVEASNVSVNLNGHTILPPIGAVGGTGIIVGLPGARLSQVGISGPGLIQGLNTGISISSSDYVQVGLTTVADNLAGITATDVTALTVAGNVIGGNTTAGLTLTQSTGAQVTGNQIVGNKFQGIALQSGDSNVIAGNVVSGNSGSGILMGGPGFSPLTNSRVSSNTTNVNGVSGIQVGVLLAVSFGNEIFSNTSSVGNKSFDLEDDNAPSCGSDFWGGNVFFTKNLPCVK